VWGAMTMAEAMENEEGFKVPYYVALTTYLSYAILFTVGHLRDAYRTILRTGKKVVEVRVSEKDLCPRGLFVCSCA
jgi:hypothetical protein